jgi:hypothetical protein
MRAEEFLGSALVGNRVERVQVQRCFVGGTLVDPCSMLFIQTPEQTLRLFFDHGVFFCRAATEQDFVPASDRESELHHDVVEADGAEPIVGQVVQEARRVQVPAASIRLKFENGRTLTLASAFDRNELVIGA